MSIFHFPIRKRTLVAGLSLLSLSVIGGGAFGQESPDNELGITEEIARVIVQDEKEAPKDKREQEALRKQRDAITEQREALDRQLSEISRKLGEPVVRINGNFNSTARAFNFDTKPFIALRGKNLEETKSLAEARRKAIEGLRKSMRGQNKEVAEEMQRAVEELERTEKMRGDERHAFRFFNDAEGRAGNAFTLPTLPDLPKTEFRFDNRNTTLPRNLEGNKEFEASMRRFEQKMQTWQKQFEARMKDWQRQLEEKNEKKP